MTIPQLESPEESMIVPCTYCKSKQHTIDYYSTAPDNSGESARRLLVNMTQRTAPMTIASVGESSLENVQTIIDVTAETAGAQKGCSMGSMKRSFRSISKSRDIRVDDQSLGVSFADSDGSAWTFWARGPSASHKPMQCGSCDEGHIFVQQSGDLSKAGDKSLMIKGKMLIDVSSDKPVYHAFAPQIYEYHLADSIAEVAAMGLEDEDVCTAGKVDEVLTEKIVPPDDELASRLFYVSETR